MIENIRYSIGQEYQKKYEMEKAKFEGQLRQIRDDHEAALAEARARSSLKDTAEMQVKFNEALAKAISEKDKEMNEKLLSNSSNGSNNQEETRRYYIYLCHITFECNCKWCCRSTNYLSMFNYQRKVF